MVSPPTDWFWPFDWSVPFRLPAVAAVSPVFDWSTFPLKHRSQSTSVTSRLLSWSVDASASAFWSVSLSLLACCSCSASLPEPPPEFVPSPTFWLWSFD